eukprot:scpid98579/ scgid12032/ 
MVMPASMRIIMLPITGFASCQRSSSSLQSSESLLGNQVLRLSSADYSGHGSGRAHSYRHIRWRWSGADDCACSWLVESTSVNAAAATAGSDKMEVAKQSPSTPLPTLA